MSNDHDPYTFDYKSYIKEVYGLNEMPVRIPDIELFKDYFTNSYEGMRVEKEAKLVGIFKFGDLNFRIFLEKDNDKFTYSLLDVNQPIVAIIHEFKRITIPIKGIENLHLFNYKNYRSLIYYWFEREIIPKEPIIMSDKVQTKDGYKFWQNIFDQYVIKNKTHKMFVIDYISGKNVGDIINKDNMNNYYGNDTYRFRFVLERL